MLPVTAPRVASDPWPATLGAPAPPRPTTADPSAPSAGLPTLTRAAPTTALDTWHNLIAAYLAARPVGVAADGETFPQTTAGDVQRTAALLSRELCRPRYDAANLGATRTAWRDALARTSAVCARLAWLDPYPENERFWLSDSLALAQRLAAVDVRRSGILTDAHGALTFLVGDRGDPLTLWSDLRQFFLSRRANRRADRGDWCRYPDTTVGDVVQVATIFDGVALRAAPRRPIAAALRQYAEDVVVRWRAASQRVAALATRLGATDVYPDNDRFWLRDTKQLALGLSAVRELTQPDPAAMLAQAVRS